MKARRVEKVLITGGAGFIGSHTVDRLIEKGYQSIIMDNLEPQVHGKEQKKPDYLNDDVFFIKKNIEDVKALSNVITDVDAIIHLAALVGVGQSMYEINKYIETNTKATAALLDILVKKEHNIKKLVVASSMSAYGEGKYYCEECLTNVYPDLRTEKQLQKQQWDQKCPKCNSSIFPIPTDEDKPLMPTSIYAQSKRHQEEMCLLIGKTYDIPTTKDCTSTSVWI